MKHIVIITILLLSICSVPHGEVTAQHYSINYLNVFPQESVSKDDNARITIAAGLIRDAQHNGCKKRHCWSNEESHSLAKIIFENSVANDISFSSLLAIMRIESNFFHNVRSDANAIGIMQTIPSTFVGIAKKHGYDYDAQDAYDLEKNIQVGCLFIKDLKEKHKKDEYIIVGYNWRPSKINAYKQYKNGDTSIYVPQETKSYIKKYKKYFNFYKSRLGD